MQQGRSSTPFADTNRVWMDFFVRATEMVAGGVQLVATAAKMAALHTGGSRSCATETAPATWSNAQRRITNLFW